MPEELPPVTIPLPTVMKDEELPVDAVGPPRAPVNTPDVLSRDTSPGPMVISPIGPEPAGKNHYLLVSYKVKL